MAGGCAVEPDADPQPDPGCLEAPRRFHVDEVASPEERSAGRDLDGDGDIDDRAGDLIRTLFSTYAEHDVAKTWRARLAERLAAQTVWAIEVPGCARGRVRDATVVGGVPLGALADFTGGSDDGWHQVHPVAIELDVRASELGGVVAGGLVDGYQAVIADVLLPFLESIDTAWTSSLDTDDDGRISRDELLADPGFRLFIAPDLDTDGDGATDALSFGLSIRARHAR